MLCKKLLFQAELEIVLIEYKLTFFIEFKRDYKKHQLSLPYAAADPGSVSRSVTTNKGEARGIASTD